MVLTSSLISPAASRILLSKSLAYGFHHNTPRRHINTYSDPTSLTLRSHTMCSSLNWLRKFKANANYVGQKLFELVPDSVHNFPWKEAEIGAMQRLIVLGQKALKCSVSAIFILSCVADAVFTISRNKELLIPFGLFFGCIATDFLWEMSKELFRFSEERGMNNKGVWGIGWFIVIIKVMAIYVLDKPVFLLNAANGGLIQLLWLWRNSSETQAFNNANDVIL